jgi:hypothetical protein
VSALFTIRAGLLAALLCGATACDRLFDKGSKQDIDAADQKVKSGDVQGAIKLYEGALDGSAKTADVHYKLALLYADKLASPLDAMHHFSRYLALAPAGAHAKEAKDYRREGEGKLLAAYSKGSPLNQDEAARLRNQNLALQKSLAELRAQKSATPASLPPGVKKGEQVQKPIPAGGRTHVVVAKETLATIAAKYYKNKARWKDIQDANFYSVDGTAKIRPGMTLYIP